MRELVRRVGQRFAIGFAGQQASSEVKKLLGEFGIGTIVLSAANVAAPEQLAELVRELQAAARACGHERPLLIGVPQEGGRVTALGEPWTAWPPARAVGRADSETIARRMGAAVASELAACGIRLSLAPVVDVDTQRTKPWIGDRSFGEDAERVGRLAAAMIAGLQEGGVAACAKHFPGIGDLAAPEDGEPAVLDHGRGRLDDVEWRPFRAAIKAEVASVMVAHVVVRELDEARPASLSSTLVSESLRDELRFQGVVVSDDLASPGVTPRWKPGESAPLAAQAGCDLLWFGQDPDTQVAGIEGLIRSFESGVVSFKKAEDSERRIRHLSDRFLAGYSDPDPKRARLAAAPPEHRALAEQIADRAGISA